MPDPSIPERFEILEELARGPAEILLRARDRTLLREVVLKLPNPGLYAPEDKPLLERVLREAQALAQVRHPGVVRLLEVIETRAGPILVMEPTAGETLADRLARRSRLPPEEVRRLGIRLCEALEAVHAVGVVHRGISIDNVVLRADGSPCLTGFLFAKFGSLAKGLPGTTFIYRPGGLPGHAPRVMPPHPAPEQVRGQRADARSDVFGLGWVLYQCLTGEAPYPTEQDADEWSAPRDPRRKAPDARKALVEAILLCLAPSPLKRTSSAREVREALEHAGPGTTGGRSVERSRRWRGVLAGALAGAALFAGARLLFPGDEARARGDDDLVDRGIGAPHEVVRGAYSDSYRQSHAILIGIHQVPGIPGLAKLPNAELDIDRVGACLNGLTGEHERWTVGYLRNVDATRDGIRESIGKHCQDAGRDDKILVYYAGHGVRNPKSETSGWVIPYDGRPESEDRGHKSWISFHELAQVFDETEAKHVLLVLDCCHGGRFAQSRSGAASTYSREYVTQRARVILTSGRGDQPVSDGLSGENSPFARAFIHELSRTDKSVLTISEIFVGILNSLESAGVGHIPSRRFPPGADTDCEVVFFLR